MPRHVVSYRYRSGCRFRETGLCAVGGSRPRNVKLIEAGVGHDVVSVMKLSMSAASLAPKGVSRRSTSPGRMRT